MEATSNTEADGKNPPKPASDEIIAAIETAIADPMFMKRLTAHVLHFARIRNYFASIVQDEDIQLPGGKKASELAAEIVEKVIEGRRTWNRSMQPDFLKFCKSQVRSEVNNWLDLGDNQRCRPHSPLPELDEGEEGGPSPNPVSGVATVHLGKTLDLIEFTRLANDYLEDFAMQQPDGSLDQRILMAVIDDHGLVKDPHEDSEGILAFDRAALISKLQVSGKEYDAALKRLKTRHPDALKQWFLKSNLQASDLRAFVYGKRS